MARLVRVGKSRIGPALGQMEVELSKLPPKALKEFKLLTPIRSGNARRRTTLDKNTIEANYPYAVRLDEGWSRQAPQGMVKPFMKWISQQVKKIVRKKR